jgi:sulfur relay (sulfurtransferase) complex TusBCD TusD component (DsrE family)
MGSLLFSDVGTAPAEARVGYNLGARIAMEKLTIILNDPPYGTEKVYNGLRFASALLSAGVSVNLFLLADGNAAARRGQKTPTGYYNVADMLSELIAKGVKVKT